MECCNSYTIDGNEPNGKITLIDHLGLEFQFTFVTCCIKLLNDVNALAFLSFHSVKEQRVYGHDNCCMSRCVAGIYADAINMSSGACYDFLRGCSAVSVEEPMKLLLHVITLNTSCRALKCIL
jgi:hypothetical protein